ncbi:hypothetical protein LTR20_010835 [Exophiala xenobiotica]|nr:hypothetical protein LTS13_000093 [Exophiala xenobiotica]KAK5391805.1 hypothetical protein LTR79_010904 [Exophiala xenobiotica]KAK5406464.1 hypothetical protein LTR90_010539 [Exophiala xenobiotica]KAK5453069.1 hypothetical protein LTR20_010835 [Exophiala xenobiotica]KAK5471751.1 hypothetical protein LTR26_010778 [Exophiala xenobiotica]
MYSLYHEEYEPKQWHVLLAYFGCSWAVCGFVMFANRALHKTNDIGLFLILAGFVILLIVCTVMPSSSGNGYATNRSVWREWQNDTGYTSNGFVFVMGMLNGAFALAPLDCVSHLAEELDNPMSMLPKAIFAMVILGFLTTFPYLITLFYAVTDLEAVMGDTTLFPLSSIYRQATGSRAGQMGLSMVLFLPCFWAVEGAYVTAGRTLWTLGRDNATPFSKYIGALHPKYQNPYNATLAVCIVNSLIGLTYLGSTTALNAFATSVLLLMITGYLAVIGAHLWSGRSRVRPGNFWMKGWIGTVVHTVSCLYTLCFTVIFSFPYSMPVAADTMNYSSLIFGGLTTFISVLWVWKMKHGYTGFTDGAVLGRETAQEGAIMVEVSQASSTQKLQE